MKLANILNPILNVVLFLTMSVIVVKLLCFGNE